jgi:hypothetical protein
MRHFWFPLIALWLLFPRSPWAQSRENAPTPFEGQRVMAQMVGDMAADLGPVAGAGMPRRVVTLPPRTAAPVSSETVKPAETVIPQSENGAAATSQPLLPESEILEHQDLHFHGNEPWEDLSLTVLCSLEKFELYVRSPFPVQSWSLFTKEGSFIGSGRVPDLDSFYFLIDEDYRPAYELVLYVNYHDAFYKLKLLLE